LALSGILKKEIHQYRQFELFNFSPTLKKALSNLTWLSVDRVVRLFGAVIINAWLTRYLGPERNGIFGYALAFVGIFSPLAVMGMDNIVIRDIVRDLRNKDEILGSAFLLRLIASVVTIFLVVVAILVLRPEDKAMQVMVMMLSVGFIFQSFDVIDYWFQSQVQSKYIVYAKNSAFFLLGAVKIICLLIGADLFVFVVANTVEFIVASIGLIFVYTQTGQSIRLWKIKLERAKTLLRDSWPIIITQLALFAQSRIDQVMIGEFMTTKDVGLYSAAQKISEPLSFIPMIIISSVFPVLVKTKEWSEKEYYSRLTNLYRLMFILSMAICIPFAIFSKSIVFLLYGDQFAASAWILSFVIWTRFYAFYGVARSVYISAENLFRHSLISSLAGVSVSILSNYLLIPKLGIYGSIISTHLGFLVTIFVVDGLSSRTKENFSAMMKGVFTFYKFRLAA
jgi:PST family polysaccharide transporter